MPVSLSDTAPTRFLDAAGTRFAYRRFGTGTQRPVVFLQHFRGNMDNFDPAISDVLAADREVVVFDTTGVGLTTGDARNSVAEMAVDAADFITAIGLGPVDLIAHSMGGYVAQDVALTSPHLVRRLVLVGTGPRGGEGMANTPASTARLFELSYPQQDEMWLPIMFSPSEKGQVAGHAYLQRIRARPDRDRAVSAATARAHRAAASAWGRPVDDGWAYLRQIPHRTLVVNGSHDIVVATVNSYLLQQHLPNAELHLYPDSNHGAHFQYHRSFSQDVIRFLARNALDDS